MILSLCLIYFHEILLYILPDWCSNILLFIFCYPKFSSSPLSWIFCFVGMHNNLLWAIWIKNFQISFALVHKPLRYWPPTVRFDVFNSCMLTVIFLTCSHDICLTLRDWRLLKLTFRHFSIFWAFGHCCEHLSGRWRRDG